MKNSLMNISIQAQLQSLQLFSGKEYMTGALAIINNLYDRLNKDTEYN